MKTKYWAVAKITMTVHPSNEGVQSLTDISRCLALALSDASIASILPNCSVLNFSYSNCASGGSLKSLMILSIPPKTLSATTLAVLDMTPAGVLPVKKSHMEGIC